MSVAEMAATNGGGLDTDDRMAIGTVQGILDAPSDLKEEILEVPEWGCSIKIRSLTAADAAKVAQAAADRKTGGVNATFAESVQKAQFLAGVVEPKFTKDQVNVLHHKFGPGFARVIDALNAISGTTQGDLSDAEDSFPQSDD